MLQVGNTEVVATMISSAVAVDVFRIEARPAIAGALPALRAYDTVLVGSGIWNVRPPTIMRTFVENVDLTGKTIFPFVTYAVSGLGRTVDDYTRLCPRSRIGKALAVRGEQVRGARGDVEAWLRRVGLLPA